MIQLENGSNGYPHNEYSWVAITVISIAVALLYEYEVLGIEDRKTAKFLYKKNILLVASF